MRTLNKTREWSGQWSGGNQTQVTKISVLPQLETSLQPTCEAGFTCHCIFLASPFPSNEKTIPSAFQDTLTWTRNDYVMFTRETLTISVHFANIPVGPASLLTNGLFILHIDPCARGPLRICSKLGAVFVFRTTNLRGQWDGSMGKVTFPTKPANLSLISGTYMVTALPSCSLTTTCTPWQHTHITIPQAHVHTRTLENAKIFKLFYTVDKY